MEWPDSRSRSEPEAERPRERPRMASMGVEQPPQSSAVGRQDRARSKALSLTIERGVEPERLPLRRRSTALVAGSVVDIWHWRNAGYLMQCVYGHSTTFAT